MNQKELKKWLDYDPNTGIFTWKISNSNRVKVGDVAGCIRPDGYVKIGFCNKNYLAHRLAWLFTYNYWPREIDHINRNKADNRIVNLRECTRSENRLNTNTQINNVSGITGVYWYKQRNQWMVYITKNKEKRVFLGYFNSKQEAIIARERAEKGC